MVSIIVYGRNDQYGYNQQKRVAISLNCMAEVLDHPDDELLFVDCNTQNDFVTLPEAIHDILTEKAKEKLRIFRIRPDQYEAHRKGSHLPALEAFSRNVALRRSNPNNRWILSTNTDMVFIPQNPQRGLRAAVENIPDGLYELPRFEIAESLWETLDRTKPKEIMESMMKWGQKFFINEFCVTFPVVRFENHGDFQLVPRHQMFDIHGFDEDMVFGWSVDSNLCKRLNILNDGKTEHLFEKNGIVGYHCSHTRQPHKIHKSDKTTFNDMGKFFFNVNSPHLPKQAETWGAPSESIEEIHLKQTSRFFLFPKQLEKCIEGIPYPYNPVIALYGTGKDRRHVLYNSPHIASYLLSLLGNLPQETAIGYVGGNRNAIKIISQYLEQNSWKKPLEISPEPWKSIYPNAPLPCASSEMPQLVQKSDILVFDAYMGFMDSVVNYDGVHIYPDNEVSLRINSALDQQLKSAIETEIELRKTEKKNPKLYIFIGYEDFPDIVPKEFSASIAPSSNRVSSGYLPLDQENS